MSFDELRQLHHSTFINPHSALPSACTRCTVPERLVGKRGRRRYSSGIQLDLLLGLQFAVIVAGQQHVKPTAAEPIIVEEKRLIEQLREFTESKEPEAESSNQKLFLSKPDWYQILFPCIE